MFPPAFLSDRIPSFRYVRPAARSSVLFDPRFPYREDLLQFIWERRLFDPHGLCTTDGRRIEVVHPGYVQDHGGPDLRDARVRIDGIEWAGTVEVHVRSGEWTVHGHHRDPAYDNVVLHVVFRCDGPVRCSNGRLPPTVVIGDRIRTQDLQRYQDLFHNGADVPCSHLIGRMDPHRLGLWLETILVQRLERRDAEVQRAAIAAGEGNQEVLYRLLLRAFGGHANAGPFDLLATALPWRLVQKYRDDPVRVAALVFGQAGLLAVDHVDAYPRQLRVEHAALASLHGLRPVPFATWKFARSRPSNFPSIRLAQLAGLLVHSGDDLHGLVTGGDLAALVLALQVPALTDYWNERYRFDQPSPPSVKRAGRAMAEGIVINAVVPYLVHLSRKRGRPELLDRALEILGRLPAEKNVALDRWAARGVRAIDAGRGQALLELERTHCAPKRCLSCAVGRHLLSAG